MSDGFSELMAPVYSKTLVDERGDPLLLGYAPVRWDSDCPTALMYRISTDVVGPRRGLAQTAAERIAVSDSE